MRILVILGHPDPKSLNAAMARTAAARLRQNGHEVVFSDLQAEGFDPILPPGEAARDATLPPDIARRCRELAEADGLVVVHPNWWGQPPAVLKGWIDRVVRPGVAYEFLEGDGGEGVPRGLLKAKTAVVLNTSNTPEARENEVFGDPLERLWRDCVFRFCGVQNVHRRTFRVVCLSAAEERAAWLAEVEDLMDRHFPAGT